MGRYGPSSFGVSMLVHFIIELLFEIGHHLPHKLLIRCQVLAGHGGLLFYQLLARWRPVEGDEIMDLV